MGNVLLLYTMYNYVDILDLYYIIYNFQVEREGRMSGCMNIKLFILQIYVDICLVSALRRCGGEECKNFKELGNTYSTCYCFITLTR